MVRRRLFAKIFQSFYRIAHSAGIYIIMMSLVILPVTVTIYLLFSSAHSEQNISSDVVISKEGLYLNRSTKITSLRLLKKKRSRPNTNVTTTLRPTTVKPKIVKPTTLIRSQNIVRYSFIDHRALGVNIHDLDQVYHPPHDIEIDFPSINTHPLSNIITLKGDPSLIIYNRIPHCYEFTSQRLLQDVSYLNKFHYVSSQIYIPFGYDSSSLLTIARSLLNRTLDNLLYERHIYFFNFYDFKIATHPVWINIIRDPLYRIAFEYYRTREICRETGRCFVRKELLNETLDNCVLKYSPRECISPTNGISRMLPFFCGSKDLNRCQEESDWALTEAKMNIQFYYTVVGYAEDFYKFLYVLEKIVPQFFKLSRLVYMNQWDPKKLSDDRDVDVPRPNRRTEEILRPLLHFEYQLYHFVKDRFLQQFNILLELDN